MSKQIICFRFKSAKKVHDSPKHEEEDKMEKKFIKWKNEQRLIRNNISSLHSKTLLVNVLSIINYKFEFQLFSSRHMKVCNHRIISFF